jgi:hypothetical protein
VGGLWGVASNGGLCDGGVVSVVLVLMRLGAAVATAILAQGQVGGEEFVLSWYGSEGDGCLGSKHGAAWNGEDCGLPELVDEIHYGAAGPRWLPY